MRIAVAPIQLVAIPITRPAATTATDQQSFGAVKMRAIVSGILGLTIMASPAIAWSGYDWETGTDVEIEKGNLVRPGLSIEVYDYGTGEYHDVEVQSITGGGTSVEVEVFDNTTGEYRTLEMEE
jgi:hypothetical protein